MERRFDMSEFEQSLKEYADQFKLMPSKRVWNGIYNHLHPGSKWPSITVAIIFLITLFTIGNLNNAPKNSNNKQLNASNSNSKSTNNPNSVLERKVVNEKNKLDINSSENQINRSFNAPEKTISESNSVAKDVAKLDISEENISLSKKNTGRNNPQLDVTANSFSETIIVNPSENKSGIAGTSGVSERIPTSLDFNESDKNLNTNENAFSLAAPFNYLNNELIVPVSREMVLFPPDYSLTYKPENKPGTPSKNINSEKSNQANKVAHGKVLRKKNKNIEWTFYVTPLISSVSLHKKPIQSAGSQNGSSVVVLPNQHSYHPIRNARLGFETGTEMTYQFSKKFKLITGFNINYSSYNNISNLVHPSFATLFLKDKSGTYSKSYVTHYGNGQSPNHISLTNYNFEVSVPVGLKYNIWKNGKIQIEVASVLEPSAVLKSNAFLISSDENYYVNDPSLIRKFNVSGNFGSYITFKAKKIKWHIGPDFRYQLLSTYKNIYPGKEHLIDYGIRIGISK